MAYDVTSQWDDIHRKLGNYEELPVEKKQSEYTKEAVDKMENYDPFKSKNLDELDEIEDEFDDEFLEQYKAKRLGEIEELKGKPAYGYVKDITRQDYVDNVDNPPLLIRSLKLQKEYMLLCISIKHILNHVKLLMLQWL